jgi:hypothetical protein
MGLLSASQWPAELLPQANMNSIVAQSQTPPIDQDPMIMNNARYNKLTSDFAGTAQFGSHHAEPYAGRGA